MSGIAFGDVAKMFLLRICFILFVFYLEGSCKTWLSLTEKKNKALKLVAEVRTKKEFSWFIFYPKFRILALTQLCSCATFLSLLSS